MFTTREETDTSSWHNRGEWFLDKPSIPSALLVRMSSVAWRGASVLFRRASSSLPIGMGYIIGKGAFCNLDDGDLQTGGPAEYVLPINPLFKPHLGICCSIIATSSQVVHNGQDHLFICVLLDFPGNGAQDRLEPLRCTLLDLDGVSTTRAPCLTRVRRRGVSDCGFHACKRGGNIRPKNMCHIVLELDVLVAANLLLKEPRSSARSDGEQRATLLREIEYSKSWL